MVVIKSTCRLRLNRKSSSVEARSVGWRVSPKGYGCKLLTFWSPAKLTMRLFSAPGPTTSSLTTPPRARRKAIPLSEVADVIVKSSKTPISFAEAETSLSMITDLCPFFLTSKVVGKQEWLEMPASVAQPPSPSPTSYIPSGPAVTVPAFSGTGGPSIPTSPSPKARSRLGGDLAGPASPGRLRRGGLREVRERIRKELGDW